MLVYLSVSTILFVLLAIAGKKVDAEVLPKPMNVEQLAEALQVTRVVLIDARSHEEYQQKSIPNALSIPFVGRKTNIDTVAQFVQEDVIIVTYCESIVCNLSRDLAKLIKQRYPFAKIYFLEGGFERWRGWKARRSSAF